MNICKGHIYIIFCNVNPKIYYIGSTFNELRHRWSNHKDSYKQKRHRLSIHVYFDKYGIENFTIKLIKTYDVYREHSKDRKHLEAYEQLWINKLRDCCNANNPFNILWKIQKKEYAIKNKEKIAKYDKKKWRDNNKEKIKENYENNKEQIAEKRKEKVTCECGSIIRKCALGRHKKSIKHNGYITLFKNIDNI